MKKLRQLILTGLLIGLAGIILTACSDDDPQYIKKDIKGATELFKRMSNGEVEAAYKVYDLHRYKKHENTGNKWVEILETEYGGIPEMKYTWYHSNFFIKNGCVWFEEALNGTLGSVWDVFCKVTGTYSAILLPYPITFTQEGTHVIFGNYECELIYADNNMFTLAHESTYSQANKDGIPTPGLRREVKTYKLDPDALKNVHKYNWYNSKHEMIVDIIAQIRADFGDVFDINDYLPTNRRWDRGSIINLDKLEEDALKQIQSETTLIVN